MKRFNFSLSRRLLFGLIFVTFAFWAVIFTLTTQDNVEELNELYDVHLAHSALALLRVTNPTSNKPEATDDTENSVKIEQIFNQWPDLPERATEATLRRSGKTAKESTQLASPTVVSKNVAYGKNLIYQAWHNDGSLLYRSDNAPTSAMTEKLGFSNSNGPQGNVWRHYSIWDRKHEVRVIVSESHELRHELVQRIVLNSVKSIALGLPVLVFLLWFSIRKGLGPLSQLSEEIAQRKPDNLRLLDESSAPSEVRPMVVALNNLLKRMAQAYESERRFTDNAAHELRTPLAAIQAQLYAARNTQNDEERTLAMAQLQNCVEKSIRLVGQMLALARLDPAQTLPDAVQFDFGEVTQEVCAELAPLALQRDQTLELVAEPHLFKLKGNPDMLCMLLCNLLDNAIRYTQRGGLIVVDLRQSSAGLQLQISDNGPGIDASQRERVFERFYRLPHESQPGTGLGLAICRRIAELHNARIELLSGPAGQGVTAQVIFSEETQKSQ